MQADGRRREWGMTEFHLRAQKGRNSFMLRTALGIWDYLMNLWPTSVSTRNQLGSHCKASCILMPQKNDL